MGFTWDECKVWLLSSILSFFCDLLGKWSGTRGKTFIICTIYIEKLKKNWENSNFYEFFFKISMTIVEI